MTMAAGRSRAVHVLLWLRAGWGLGWVFRAWLDMDLVLALVNGVYGCG